MIKVKIKEKSKVFFIKFKNLVLDFFRSIFEYQKSQGTFISAAVCFYVMLGVFPLMLFVLTFLGQILGHQYVGDQLLEFLQVGLPQLGDGLIANLKEIMAYRLSGTTFSRVLALGTLIVSSVSLVDAVFKGLYVVTKIKHLNRGWYHPKHLASMGLIVLFFLGLLVIPGVLNFFFNLALEQINVLTHFSKIPFLNWVPDFLNWINFVGKYELLAKANVIHLSMALMFLAVLFKWIFESEVPWRDCFRGATVFALMFGPVKALHYVYLFYAKNGLDRNYGGFAHIIIVTLWIYYLINLFYLSAMVCVRRIGHNRNHD